MRRPRTQTMTRAFTLVAMAGLIGPAVAQDEAPKRRDRQPERQTDRASEQDRQVRETAIERRRQALDRAVKNGTLTREKADEMMERATQNDVRARRDGGPDQGGERRGGDRQAGERQGGSDQRVNDALPAQINKLFDLHDAQHAEVNALIREFRKEQMEALREIRGGMMGNRQGGDRDSDAMQNRRPERDADGARERRQVKDPEARPPRDSDATRERRQVRDPEARQPRDTDATRERRQVRDPEARQPRDTDATRERRQVKDPEARQPRDADATRERRQERDPEARQPRDADGPRERREVKDSDAPLRGPRVGGQGRDGQGAGQGMGQGGGMAQMTDERRREVLELMREKLGPINRAFGRDLGAILDEDQRPKLRENFRSLDLMPPMVARLFEAEKKARGGEAKDGKGAGSDQAKGKDKAKGKEKARGDKRDADGAASETRDGDKKREGRGGRGGRGG